MIQNPLVFQRVRSSSVPYTSVPNAGETLKEEHTEGGTLCGFKVLASWGKPSRKTESSSQTVWDCVTPNFKSRISSGEIINNPFCLNRTREWYAQPVAYSNRMYKNSYLSCSPSGSVQYQRYIHGDIVPGAPGFLSSSATVSLRDSVMNLAVTQAHASVDVSSMMALATAAESRKTIDSVFDISRRAYKVLRNVRKLNFRALRKELRPSELSDRYMEARYAIRPLMYDLRGACEAIKKPMTHIRQTFRGYASDSLTRSDTISAYLQWGSNATWKRTEQYYVSARAGVLCDVEIDAINTYGVDQPLETAWELVPFSFIADWFANIGDTLAAWTPNSGVNQRASWVTVRETRTLTNSLVAATSALPVGYTSGVVSCGPTTAGREESFLERVVNPTLSIWPQSNIRLDGYKLTDLGIMFRNLFR